ncbi:MAG: tetratricopeptide repeat protein [Planctomycetota bacterium]
MERDDAPRGDDGVPGVYLMPFAVPEPLDLPGLDGEVVARRLPDVLHLLLNGGRSGPAGMLEVQSPPSEGPRRWVTLSDEPSPEEVFTMIGAEAGRCALVVGTLRNAPDGLTVDLSVHFGRPRPADGETNAEEPPPSRGVHGIFRLGDPAGSLMRIAEHLAQVLGMRFQKPPRHVFTGRADAFLELLDGLDGAALLAGDPALETERNGEDLLLPLVRALKLDPGFGLALRTLAAALFPAIEGGRIDVAACGRVVDLALSARPLDGEGCVAISDQLNVIGDETRARAWLEHAITQEDPPSRAFESLGVALANEKETGRARELWLHGLSIDGNPDFFGHLAQLAFSEEHPAEGWDRFRRGLRRMRERALRSAEWAGESRAPSVLLRYLAERLDDQRAPDEVRDAIVELAGLLEDPVERADLGSCLVRVGREDLAGEELRPALDAELPLSTRERATRALLAVEVPGFEARFQAASERALRGRDPRGALLEMQACLDRAPDFWPAMFYAGVALRRLGREEEALDLMNEVLSHHPGQADALGEMAEMFDSRGNSKRALECVDEALVSEPEDVELHLLRAQCLDHLGRRRDADASLDRAIELEPDNPKHRRLRRRRAR